MADYTAAAAAVPHSAAPPVSATAAADAPRDAAVAAAAELRAAATAPPAPVSRSEFADLAVYAAAGAQVGKEAGGEETTGP